MWSAVKWLRYIEILFLLGPYFECRRSTKIHVCVMVHWQEAHIPQNPTDLISLILSAVERTTALCKCSGLLTSGSRISKYHLLVYPILSVGESTTAPSRCSGPLTSVSDTSKSSSSSVFPLFQVQEKVPLQDIGVLVHCQAVHVPQNPFFLPLNYW